MMPDHEIDYWENLDMIPWDCDNSQPEYVDDDGSEDGWWES